VELVELDELDDETSGLMGLLATAIVGGFVGGRVGGRVDGFGLFPITGVLSTAGISGLHSMPAKHFNPSGQSSSRPLRH